MVDQRHRAPGLEVALLDVDPHRVVERHSHDEAHMVFVLDGLYVSSAQGAPPVSSGEALVFNPAGTTHRDRFEARGRVVSGQFLTLSIGADIMTAAEAEWGAMPRAVALQRPDALSTARQLAGASRYGAASALEWESIALALLGEVSRSSAPPVGGAPSWLRMVRMHLDDALGEPLGIRDLARTAGVHPVHLARVFRQCVGESPGAYQRRRRLEHAATLLRDTRRPISAIALACGFSDQAHLSRTFRAAYGVPPLAYRRERL